MGPAFAEGVDPMSFSVRMQGQLTAPESGAYRFGLITGGQSRLFVDGDADG